MPIPSISTSTLNLLWLVISGLLAVLNIALRQQEPIKLEYNYFWVAMGWIVVFFIILRGLTRREPTSTITRTVLAAIMIGVQVRALTHSQFNGQVTTLGILVVAGVLITWQQRRVQRTEALHPQISVHLPPALQWPNIREWYNQPIGWLDISRGQALCLLISLLLAINTGVKAGTKWEMIAPYEALVSWGLAAMLLAGTWPIIRPVGKPQRITLLWLGGLILFAFALRAFNTAGIPNNLSGDEAGAGTFSLLFRDRVVDNLFTVGWFSFPTFFNFIQSLSIRLFGQTTEGLRLLSALIGALTVGAVYLLGQTLFGRRAGVLAALFLACFNYHIHFSRVGLNNIWDGLAYPAVLGAFWIGWRQERRTAYILSGLVLGLAQYFYPSSRLLVVVLGGWLLALAVGDMSRLRRALPNLLLMGFTALVISLPLWMMYIQLPFEFVAPMERVGIWGEWMNIAIDQTHQAPWLIVVQQFGIALMGFVDTPLRNWYDTGTPLLRPISAVLFIIGLGLLVRNWRKPGFVLTLLWMAVMVVIAALSESTPAAQRYIIAAPLAALVIGYALAELGHLLETLWPARTRLAATGVLVVCLLIGLDELRFYFLEFTPSSTFGGYSTAVAQRLADELKTRSTDWEVLFFGGHVMDSASIASLYYLQPNFIYTDVKEPWATYSQKFAPSLRMLFVFLPTEEENRQAVMADYPNWPLDAHYKPDGQLLFYTYAVGE